MEETLRVINRDLYLDRVRPFIDKNIIKVITGQRRVGKSYILKSIASEIRIKNPDANIIEINLEDFAFSHIVNAEALHNEIISRIKGDKKNYIFIDEIQEVEKFETVVRSLILDEKNDVYVTGSNSKMLSSEISSMLAGRSFELRVHPLSYKEFMEFHSLEDSDDSIQNYLRYGGMPYLVNLPLKDTWNEYLTGITDAVVYRDIISRHSIRNIDFLQRLLRFLADNIGNLFTAKSIHDYLKSQKLKISVTGIQNYIDYFAQAYIVNILRRWDVSGKRFFEIGEKIYFEDIGLRNIIVGYKPGDLNGLIENVVYNHLSILGYKVKIGILGGSKEIDFIAERNGEIKYIQVALNVEEEKTFEREFGNLLLISDNYEKYVVTLRTSAPNSYNGIKLLSLREFLLRDL